MTDFNSYTSKNLKSWKPMYGKNDVSSQYRTPIEADYRGTLRHKNKIECNTIKKLYNKYEVKKFFEGFGLNVPSLDYYTM